MAATTQGNQDPNICDNSRDSVSDGLLSPCHFDWADDVEDSLHGASSSLAHQVDYYAPTAKTYQAVWPISHPHYKPNLSSFQPPLDAISEEVWNDSNGWIEETPNVESSLCGNEPPTSTPQSLSSYSDYRVPLINGEVVMEVSSPYGDTNYYDEAQESVNRIFEDRDAFIEMDPRIHHFNWVGQSVYGHSTTSPSDSLAIIMATPKNIKPTCALGVRAVLNCAIQYVDPVIVVLDDTDANMLQLRGAKLAKVFEGRVYKFYSPHGRWMEDGRDSSDDTTTDFGRIKTYEGDQFAIGNGFVKSSTIRSLGQWLNEIPTAPEGIRGLPRKKTWKPQPSPLSQCETIPVSEIPQEVKSSTPKRTRRPPRKITTAVNEKVPLVYYSFPEPEFGKSRLKDIKKAIKRAFFGFKSWVKSSNSKDL